MKLFYVVFVVLLIGWVIFGIKSIGEEVKKCEQAGGTAVQTHEGTTCIKGVIKIN